MVLTKFRRRVQTGMIGATGHSRRGPFAQHLAAPTVCSVETASPHGDDRAAESTSGTDSPAPGPQGSASANRLPGTAALSAQAAETPEAPPSPAGASTVAEPGVAHPGAGRDSGPDPDAPVSPSPATPVPGDDLWAPTFGGITVAAYPTVVAVHGEEVYIGGTFTLETAGLPNDTYVRVARWDGSSWRRMGDGVDGAVHAIAVVGDDVYVGGEFAVAGGTPASRLARWDGTAWSEVGGGVGSSRPWSLVAVRALACDGQKLYVAGAFDSAGAGDAAVLANGFAVLDLVTGGWESPDGGLGFLADPGEGHALALVGDRLYVGGSFDRAGSVQTASFAALDLRTGSWEGFGTGVRNGDYTGTVEALALDEATGTLVLGGRFTAAGDVATSGVATLEDGAYGSLGAFAYYGDPGGAAVVALAHADGRLYAAGTFTTAAGADAEHWAVHDGAGWSVPARLDNSVAALARYGDRVVVAGTFGFSDPLRVPHVAVWTGSGWQTFGQGLGHDPYSNVYVYALHATPAGVYAGGYFDQAGSVRVGSVAQWRDDAWHDLAGGVQSPHVLGEVFAMLGVGDDVYVTGQFETAGGVAAANIARWDGSGWSPLGGGIQGTGYALAMLGGRLYVGGGFYLAGDVPVSNVASWDPATSTWSRVGSAPTYDGDVFALAAVQDRYLVVGGYFTKLYAGRFQVSGMNSLALFDTHEAPDPADPWVGYSRIPGVTQSWQPGVVSALQVLGSDLYVGGSFDSAGVESWTAPPGAGFAASNLATWHFTAPDGAWSTPGAADRPVKAFATLDGRSLLVGGGFGTAGGVQASAVVEHDPATGAWTAYGSGIGWGARGVRQVEALAQGPAGLWAGGTFTVAGAVPSCGLALWRGTAGRTP